MNFNKDYPIAILDTNIVMDVPNILDILKGCNIVIPFTLIEELDNHKKENKGARDFVNNFLALSEKANLSKDGYKLENDCMLYLDIDKNNLHHKDINLDSKKQDIKFIAEAKNLKEKYNDMEVVLISSDKIMKITASNFEVEVKTLEEFISKYIKDNDKNAILDILYNLFEEYSNSELIYKMIYDILVNSNNIDGLFKLAEKSRYNYKPNSSKEIYEKIYEICINTNNVDGLFKLSDENSSYNSKEIYEKIFTILSENKDIDGLYKLSEIYYSEEIFTILSENKDIDGLYKLSESYNPNEEVYEKISNILAENKDIDGLYKLSENILKLVNKHKEETIRKIKIDIKIDILENIYNKIFTILSENKDIDGLYKLSESYNPNEEVYEKISNILVENEDIDGLYKLAKYYNNAYNKIFEILSENKDIDGLYKLSESYNPDKKIYEKISNILAENKDIDGLYKLSESYNPNKEVYKKIFEILSENKDIDGLYKLSESYNPYKEIYKKLFEILSEAEDLEGLFKLAGKYNNEAIYEKICEILDKEEDKNKLYKLNKNKDIKNLLSNSSHPKINEIMLKMLIDKIEELEN